MRSEWEIKILGDLCEISSSKRIFAKEYCSKGIPFYRGKEIIEKHKGNAISTQLFISEERYEEIKERYDVPKIGDILLSSVGTLGVPWLVDEEKFYFKDGNLTWLRPGKGVDNKFLYLWLCSSEAKRQINAKCIGSTQKAITIETLGKFEICIPSIATQRKISGILFAIINKIELNKKINDNLQQQAQALYREMFINKTNTQRRTCRAEEYFEIAIGKTPPRKEHQWFTTNPSDVTWVSISDMGSCGTFISRSSEQLTQEAVDKFNIKVIPNNTVLLSFKLTVGRVAITHGEITTNEAIAHFKTDKPFINEYLYCYLRDFNYQTMGSTSSIATAVNSKIIKAMPFVIPTDDEISRFHSVVGPMFERILNNQLENDLLVGIRDTLLPRLMSGELDVSALD